MVVSGRRGLVSVLPLFKFVYLKYVSMETRPTFEPIFRVVHKKKEQKNIDNKNSHIIQKRSFKARKTKIYKACL